MPSPYDHCGSHNQTAQVVPASTKLVPLVVTVNAVACPAPSNPADDGLAWIRTGLAAELLVFSPPKAAPLVLRI